MITGVLISFVLVLVLFASCLLRRLVLPPVVENADKSEREGLMGSEFGAA